MNGSDEFSRGIDRMPVHCIGISIYQLNHCAVELRHKGFGVSAYALDLLQRSKSSNISLPWMCSTLPTVMQSILAHTLVAKEQSDLGRRSTHISNGVPEWRVEKLAATEKCAIRLT